MMPSSQRALLVAILVALPSHARADGIANEAVSLGHIVNDSGYALAVTQIKRLKGKHALEATIEQVWLGKNVTSYARSVEPGKVSMPGDPNKLKTKQRLALPTYRAPAARAGKWVLAKRYWNPCPEAVKGDRLLVSESSYFEVLCDTPSNRRRVEALLDPKAYAKKTRRTQLRKDLADPDLFRPAYDLLRKGRRGVPHAWVLKAAESMPAECGVNVLKVHFDLSPPKAHAKLLRFLLARAHRMQKRQTMHMLAYQLRRANDRAYLPPLIAAMGRIDLRRSEGLRGLCKLMEPLLHLLKKRNSRDLVAARRLVRKLARIKAIDEVCGSARKRLEKRVKAPEIR